MRQTISLALLGGFLLGVTGCATIAMPPIMAITTPISCIKESIKHGNAGEILLTTIAAPFIIPGGFLFGLGMGIITDLEGKNYQQAFKAATHHPCR